MVYSFMGLEREQRRNAQHELRLPTYIEAHLVVRGPLYALKPDLNRAARSGG